MCCSRNMLIESHVYFVVSINISIVASVVIILIPMVHYISIGNVVSSGSCRVGRWKSADILDKGNQFKKFLQ